MQAARQGHYAGCIATSLLLAGRQLCEQISYSVILNHGRACLRVMPKFSECPSPDQYLAGALHHRAPSLFFGLPTTLSANHLARADYHNDPP